MAGRLQLYTEAQRYALEEAAYALALMAAGEHDDARGVLAAALERVENYRAQARAEHRTHDLNGSADA